MPLQDTLAVIEPGRLHVLEHDTWHAIDTPPSVRNVDRAPDGTLWIVGSQPGKRARAETEVACWKREPNGDTWQPVTVQPASWWQAYKVIGGGGFEVLDYVNARCDPLVVASQCAWWIDDPRWFMFVRLPDGRFHVQRMPEGFAGMDRAAAGAPILWTEDGEIWDWRPTKWIPRGTRKALEAALAMPRRPSFTHLRTINGVTWVGWVDILTDEEFGTAVCVRSLDGGATWERLDVIEGERVRVVGAWVEPSEQERSP